MDVLQLVRDRVRKKYVKRDAFRLDADFWCVMCRKAFANETAFDEHKAKIHKLIANTSQQN